MDDSGGCLGALLALGAIGGIIYVIVVYVVPIILAAGAIVIGVFALIGSGIGIVKSIKNVVLAIKELAGRPKSIRKYKNDYAIAAVHDRNT